jgi:hypothetical protein
MAAPGSAADLTRQREVVGAFLAASLGRDFEALIALLDANVVFELTQQPCRRAPRARYAELQPWRTRCPGVPGSHIWRS